MIGADSLSGLRRELPDAALTTCLVDPGLTRGVPQILSKRWLRKRHGKELIEIGERQQRILT